MEVIPSDLSLDVGIIRRGLEAVFVNRSILCILISLFPTVAFSQTNPSAIGAHQWRQQHEREILDEFVTLLSIPNIASDHANIQRNADTIAKMMKKRGISPRLVSVPGANPVVFGEIRTPGAKRTIVLYAHYDGQPVDPKEWATPPFTPTLRDRQIDKGGQVIPLPVSGMPLNPEWRLYARGAADDKAPIEAMMAALDAIRAAGLKTKSNIKFAFEGEEEAYSVNLDKILTANKELFSGDVWLICDGPVSQTRRQSVIFGTRGFAAADITVYGPRTELHSGHYGNWALNPAMMLARLLASMKDENGHVLVDHFYEGIQPLSDTEKRAIAESPNVDPQLMDELWLGSTESAPKTLAELVTLPSLNIRGMSSARVGLQASSVIPASATASIDMRLVKGMHYQQTTQQLIEHIRGQGFFVVDQEPSAEVRRSHPKVAWVVVRPGGYNSVRTSMDLPISEEVIKTVESARGPAVRIPNWGASVPLDTIEQSLGTRTIIIPIANHDNNQHSFDENLRIQNLWDGIELMAALLTM
jgi:acetylornithine deacetylase/succinyl-diaminopimelate desuccinylase-like protein